jgi:DNA repair exonuclease SbcCD ATPase subunit
MKMNNNKSQPNLKQRFISIVKESFRGLRRKYKIAHCVIFLTVLFAGLTLAGILESIFYLPAAAKFSITVLTLVSAVCALLYYYQQLNTSTFKEYYQQFSRKTDNPKLSDALDLHFDPGTKKPPLHEVAIRQNLEKLNPQDIKSALDRYSKDHPIHKYYRAGLSGALGAFLLFIGFSLLQPTAMDRLAHLWVNYTPPNPYSYTIEPGTLTLEQGKAFTPQISFDGDYPEELSLAFKTDIEEQFRQRNPISVDNNQATFSSVALTTHGSYYFEMDGFRSEEFTVTVQLRPRLEQLSLQVVPPSYTQLDTTSYSYPFSTIQAYRGSEIILEGISNKPVTEFSMDRTNAPDSVNLIHDSANDTIFSHQWTVGATDTVSFNMADSAGLTNKNKFRFVVEPRDDQHPFVNLISPSQNTKMKNPELVQLEYEAGDDFGLTSASLHFELQRAFTNNPEKGSHSLPKPAMNNTETYQWDVPSLNPKPRDQLTYWIEVRDNDGYNGAKIGRSQKLIITFPSTTEYMEELESKESEVTESLDNISDSFEQMEQEYEEFKNQLKQNPETNWEQKQQLEEVEEERKKIDQQVEELNKKFEEIRKEIEKNQALSPETMETYDELQKLMEEINDPELEEALEKLRNSLGEMNPDQMRKALQNYEFNEEQYKERINRTLELFKSLKLNSDLEKMANSLEELSEQEQEISESEQSPAEDLEQQQSIEKDLNKVQEQLDNLDKNTPEKAKKQIEKLQQDADKQIKKTQEELQENMEQLREQQDSPQSSPATKQQQRQIQKQMQQTAQQMRESKQQLNQQQMQVNMAALEYVLYSLINLSTNQEELTKETENIPNASQAFVEKARKERNISNQFSTLSDSLFQLSSEIPGFGNRINKKKAEVERQLSRAVEMLAERNKSNSTYAQRQSLGGINELSSMVASLLEQLHDQQQGGGGGAMSMQQLMEQLGDMSGQQQKLNEQIQNMINDIQGNRLNQDQMERLNQLSKQQNQIRKQIRELQRQGELDSGDRVLSELERMSEQMEDAINDLRGGQLDHNMMQRQQNILSRMLSAEKAVQERGKEDRREATTAEERPDSVPPDITLEQLQQKIRKMLNDPDRTQFTEDYQRLIEQYFELLKEQEKEIIQ